MYKRKQMCGNLYTTYVYCLVLKEPVPSVRSSPVYISLSYIPHLTDTKDQCPLLKLCGDSSKWVSVCVLQYVYELSERFKAAHDLAPLTKPPLN